MNTFDLKTAASFLKMKSSGLRKKAAAGEIPGAKPGKSWCFFENDLVEYLRSLYSKKVQPLQGVLLDRRTLWHSTNGKMPGGFQSTTKESGYKKLLGLPTKPKPCDTT